MARAWRAGDGLGRSGGRSRRGFGSVDGGQCDGRTCRRPRGKLRQWSRGWRRIDGRRPRRGFLQRWAWWWRIVQRWTIRWLVGRRARRGFLQWRALKWLDERRAWSPVGARAHGQPWRFDNQRRSRGRARAGTFGGLSAGTFGWLSAGTGAHRICTTVARSFRHNAYAASGAVACAAVVKAERWRSPAAHAAGCDNQRSAGTSRFHDDCSAVPSRCHLAIGAPGLADDGSPDQPDTARVVGAGALATNGFIADQDFNETAGGVRDSDAPGWARAARNRRDRSPTGRRRRRTSERGQCPASHPSRRRVGAAGCFHVAATIAAAIRPRRVHARNQRRDRRLALRGGHRRLLVLQLLDRTWLRLGRRLLRVQRRLV